MNTDHWRREEVEGLRTHDGRYPYSPENLEVLRGLYRPMKGWTPALDESIAGYFERQQVPAVGEASVFSAGGTGPRVGVYFREYPLPSEVPWNNMLAHDVGRAPLPADAMAQCLERALAEGSPYRTVRRGLKFAQKVVEQHFPGFSRDLSDLRSKILVGDWVRPFALFRDAQARPFVEALSRRSCHAKAMYALGRRKLAEEAADGHLDLVVVLGRSFTEGLAEEFALRAPRTVLRVLPHPQAWGVRADTI